MVTIIVKSLNNNLTNHPRVVEPSYFTKQAFIRGEVIDVKFHVIPTRKRSCWHGIRRPLQDEESESEDEEEQEEPALEEVQPPPTPLGDVPLLSYPIQSEPGTSSDHPPIWDQILNNEIAMQGQLNTLDRHQQEMNRRQCKKEYKLNKYFIYIGFTVESPPTTPTDD